MRKIKFVNGQYYHIYNRGADKRQIFLSNDDYLRFVRSLYNFNDSNPVLLKDKIRERISGKPEARPREELVEINCFCLMPNHYHLILRQVVDKGVTEFVRKLNTGYTMYFNKKNQRTGVLFQGKFKARLVDSTEYLLQLSRYIHLNPLSLAPSGYFKNGKVANWEEAQAFLKKYRWSSYLDYLGIKNFPKITHREFLQDYFAEKKYEEFVKEWTPEDINLFF